jgi:hypothetical protein
LVDRLLWEQDVAGSNPATPTHKHHIMKMDKDLNELESFTVEEFQADFDALLDRVERGESFLIKSEHGNAVMIPYNEVVQILEESGVSEDIIRIHTDHEEGS